MRRDIAKPLNARGFKADIGIKPASHGVVDDGLPLLLQLVRRFSSASHLHNYHFYCDQTEPDCCRAVFRLFDRTPDESNRGYHPLPVDLANRR